VSGNAENLCGPIAEVFESGITAVSFDLDTGTGGAVGGCGPVPQLVVQSDATMADLVLVVFVRRHATSS